MSEITLQYNTVKFVYSVFALNCSYFTKKIIKTFNHIILPTELHLKNIYSNSRYCDQGDNAGTGGNTGTGNEGTGNGNGDGTRSGTGTGSGTGSGSGNSMSGNTWGSAEVDAVLLNYAQFGSYAGLEDTSDLKMDYGCVCRDLDISSKVLGAPDIKHCSS